MLSYRDTFCFIYLCLCLRLGLFMLYSFDLVFIFIFIFITIDHNNLIKTETLAFWKFSPKVQPQGVA